MVSIACDDKDNKWRKALADFKMERLINLFDPDSAVAGLYNIQAYPTYPINWYRIESKVIIV